MDAGREVSHLTKTCPQEKKMSLRVTRRKRHQKGPSLHKQNEQKGEKQNTRRDQSTPEFTTENKKSYPTQTEAYKILHIRNRARGSPELSSYVINDMQEGRQNKIKKTTTGFGTNYVGVVWGKQPSNIGDRVAQTHLKDNSYPLKQHVMI